MEENGMPAHASAGNGNDLTELRDVTKLGRAELLDLVARQRKAIDGLCITRDALAFLRDDAWMLENLTATQKRCTELLEETRALKARVSELEAAGVTKSVEHAGPFARAVTLVYEERLRQNEKWGRDFGRWEDTYLFQQTVLSEEVGEVAKAILEYEVKAPRQGPAATFAETLRPFRQPIRDELVQVAAVAIAMLEAM